MTTSLTIGWVLRSSTVGLGVGCRVLQPNVPQFGDLVKVPLPDDLAVFGLIYDVQVKDDPAVRQLILAGEMEPEAILDQRENRLVPIELSVLVVGYQRDRQPPVQGLRPQPPISLDTLSLGDDADLRRFTERLDYLRLVLNAAIVPWAEAMIPSAPYSASVMHWEGSTLPATTAAG